MNYYRENAKDYIAKTKDSNMQEMYDFFLKHIKLESKLLDIGFGSGRDMLFFKKMGFNVFGIDSEPMFCEEAKKKGLNVNCGDITNICSKESDIYDCLWACASLHHVPKEMLNQTFKICSNLLKKDGIMYCSFKYGDFEGIDELGRYIHCLTEKTIEMYLDDTDFIIVDFKITDDRLNRDNRWLNVILKK